MIKCYAGKPLLPTPLTRNGYFGQWQTWRTDHG